MLALWRDQAVNLENVMRVSDPSGLTYYLGTITPNQIMELTFVPCVLKVNDDILNIRTQGGYQREGDRKRMTQIADFYKANLKSIIPPVLLSTRGAWAFSPQSKNSSLGTITASDQVSIIDGQHRLGGLSILAQDDNCPKEISLRHIPFIAVDFESIETEPTEFEIINGKQKGIKPSHLMYIRRNESFWGNAAHMLQTDPDSVFCGRIAISARRDWDLITFKAAQEIVAYTFDHVFCQNAFHPNTDDNQLKAMEILQRYWRSVSEVFDEMWSDIGFLPSPGQQRGTAGGRTKFQFRLLEETGLRAFGRLGSNILLKSWLPGSADVAWDSVNSHLSRVAQNERVQLVMQKLRSHNRDEILAVDPKLIQQGLAGEKTLYSYLYGALERN
jgi:DGQHR domain-containing protein